MTFGAPLRYRWNDLVVPRLLHFAQHRATKGHDPVKAVIPKSVGDVLTAAGAITFSIWESEELILRPLFSLGGIWWWSVACTGFLKQPFGGVTCF